MRPARNSDADARPRLVAGGGRPRRTRRWPGASPGRGANPRHQGGAMMRGGKMVPDKTMRWLRIATVVIEIATAAMLMALCIRLQIM